MRTMQCTVMCGVLVAAGVAGLIGGWWWSHPLVASGGAIVLGYVLLRAGRLWRRRFRRRPAPVDAAASHAVLTRPADPADTASLVEQMLAQGRYALLLRPQIAVNLSDRQFQQARQALEAGMALVPDGEVVLGPCEEPPPADPAAAPQAPPGAARVVRVERLFLDRYPVTNAEFYQFVVQGGYQQAALWDESILPAVLDFVDRTGQPGPRFWRHGRYEPGLDDHPVTGVSWFEAAAYARWVGKRLPSDAEWVKAASWPVTLADNTRAQRKYPWGDLMDRARANLWGSGPGVTAAVDEFPEGVSVGGVYQLIGNVWEWTRSNYRGRGPGDGELVLPTPFKSLRGGAFDTYFDSQATCQFQSGDTPLARKHNIGFRCAIGVCDLTLHRQGQSAPQAAAEEPALEEVPV